MKRAFAKMHGAGNDFIVFDATAAALELSPAQCRALADRHFGIGADQILVVGPAPSTEIDFSYRIYNADGGEVEQCGNGARAFLQYVRARHLTDKSEIRVSTLGGVIAPRIDDDGAISVDMGIPALTAQDVHFNTDQLSPRAVGSGLLWPLSIAGQTVEVALVSMGNPHAVQIVDDARRAPVAMIGAALENDPRFTQRVNAGFMQIETPHRIRLRVWERGAGETLACGTGACAAVVAGIVQQRLASPVEVEVSGGTLGVRWDGPGTSVWLSGPVVTVFDGEVDLEAIGREPLR